MVQEQKQRVSPFTEQEPFLRDDKRYFGYVAGVGSGKTAVGVMRDALNMELWNQGELGAIVAPSTQMIKNAILPLMRNFGLFERWDYKGPQSEQPGIISPNGSRAVILSADNDRQIERLAGLNLAWWHLDENKDINPRARQILIQRLRTGDYPNGYVTTTPKGKNHDYNFFVRDVDTEQYNHGQATIYEAKDRIAITAVPTDANPHLDRDDVQAIRDAHPSGLLQQEVEGQFIEIGSGVLTEDMLQFAGKDKLQSSELNFLVGVDLGVETDVQKAQQGDSDYWAAAIIAVHRRHGRAYLVDVARQRGMSMTGGVEWLRKVVNGVPNPTINVEQVAAQRWFLDECRNQGLQVQGVDQRLKKEDRLLQMSVPFENGLVRLIDSVDAESDPSLQAEKERLGYDPRWQEFVNEWLAFPEGRHDDLLDSVEIAMRGVDLSSAAMYTGDLYDRGDDT